MQLVHLPLQDAELEALLNPIRFIYTNGGAEFGCFQVSDLALIDWYKGRSQQDELNLMQAILADPTVMSVLPPLNYPVSRSLEIERGSALTLDGELAQLLVQGGAYTEFAGTGQEAKQLGQQFCQALFGDRYTDIQIYKTRTAWSHWFGDVMWDCTWFGLDLGENRVWILCVTDTD